MLRVHPLFVAAVLAAGCGGKVVVDAEAGGSGGAGAGNSVVASSTATGSTTTSSSAVGGAGGNPALDDAIQNVKEIAHAAKEHFEKTQAHCLSAFPVPQVMSAIQGTSYVPSGQDGYDFNTGDELIGWKCLGWKPAQTELRFQLNYNAAAGYLGPFYGGPDPGVHGFEAAAQGDLDADATFSLVTIAGSVDPDTKQVTLSDMFIDNPGE